MTFEITFSENSHKVLVFARWMAEKSLFYLECNFVLVFVFNFAIPLCLVLCILWPFYDSTFCDFLIATVICFFLFLEVNTTISCFRQNAGGSFYFVSNHSPPPLFPIIWQLPLPLLHYLSFVCLFPFLPHFQIILFFLSQNNELFHDSAGVWKPICLTLLFRLFCF